MRQVVLLPVVLLLSGCGGLPFGASPQTAAAPAGLALVAAPYAAPGGTTTLTLVNGTSEPVGYTLCTSALERRGGDGVWEPALSAAVSCPPGLSTLAPGQQVSAEAPLPAGLDSGDYRFVARVAPTPAWPYPQIRSERFTVTAPVIN